MNCYVGAYRGTSMMSRVITGATRSVYSHVSLIFDDCRVLESWQKSGVVKRDHFNHGHRPDTIIEVYDIAMTEAQKRRMVQFFTSQLGKKYDWRAIVSFATRSKRKHNPDKWICSEILHAASVAAGLPLQERVESHLVTPAWCVRSPHLSYMGNLVTGQPESSARLDLQLTNG